MADSRKGARATDAEREKGKRRSQARHLANAQKYEARREANLAELAALGGKIQTKTFNRTITVMEKHGRTLVPVQKIREVTKNESPSEALARTRREQAK